MPVTRQVVPEIKSLNPTDPGPCRSCAYTCVEFFLSGVADFVPATLGKDAPDSANLAHSACELNTGYDFGQQAGDSNLFVQVVVHVSPFCTTVPQIWSCHAARQTTPHDVLPPQAGSQVSHGGQEGIGGQMCWTPAIRSGTPGWCQHHDQDNSNILRKLIPPMSLLLLTSRPPSRNVSRRVMLHSIEQTDPDLAAVLSRWYTGTTEQKLHHEICVHKDHRQQWS